MSCRSDIVSARRAVSYAGQVKVDEYTLEAAHIRPCGSGSSSSINGDHPHYQRLENHWTVIAGANHDQRDRTS
ncbi:hypothetical protein E4U22_004905 [Claviceps purpurea]|nr:hypothetical protein E4U22_004905 [Claviceps purpurea]